MLQKFLLALFVIWCKQQLIARIRSAGCCALLSCLLESIDTLVQVVDSYYDSYCQVFGRWQCGKMEKLEKAEGRCYADNNDLVSASLFFSPELLQTTSADLVS